VDEDNVTILSNGVNFQPQKVDVANTATCIVHTQEDHAKQSTGRSLAGFLRLNKMLMPFNLSSSIFWPVRWYHRLYLDSGRDELVSRGR